VDAMALVRFLRVLIRPSVNSSLEIAASNLSRDDIFLHLILRVPSADAFLVEFFGIGLRTLRKGRMFYSSEIGMAVFLTQLSENQRIFCICPDPSSDICS
jgi:hypothetical protein